MEWINVPSHQVDFCIGETHNNDRKPPLWGNRGKVKQANGEYPFLHDFYWLVLLKSASGDSAETVQREYSVQAIITEKLLFSSRPRPLLQ